MKIESKVNSFFDSYSYLIENRILVDIGDYIESYNIISAVLLTHAHFDHIYGLNYMIKKNPTAMIYTNAYGAEMLANAKKNLSKYHGSPFIFDKPENIVIVKDNDYIDLSNGIKAKALFTPGHNPSCITWLIEDCLFSGDSYIPGIKTVTNLPGGNKTMAETSVNKIKELAKNRTIYPGHRI